MPRTPSAPPSSRPGANPGASSAPYASPSITGTAAGGSLASSPKPPQSGNPSPSPASASPFAAKLGSNPLGSTSPAKPATPHLHVVGNPHPTRHTPSDGHFGGGNLLAWPGTDDPSLGADAARAVHPGARTRAGLGDGAPLPGGAGWYPDASPGDGDGAAMSDAGGGRWLSDTLPFISPGVSTEFPHELLSAVGPSLLSTGADIAPTPGAVGVALPAGRVPLRIFETPSLLDSDPAPPDGVGGSREGTPLAGETWSLRRAPSNSLLTAQSFPNGCLEGSPHVGVGAAQETEGVNPGGLGSLPASPRGPPPAKTHPSGGTVVAHVTVGHSRTGSVGEGTTGRQSAGAEVCRPFFAFLLGSRCV